MGISHSELQNKIRIIRPCHKKKNDVESENVFRMNIRLETL